MRIRRRFSAFVLVIFLLSAMINAEESVSDAMTDHGAEKEGKISTSLRIDEDIFRNKTDKIRQVVTSAMKVPEKREQIGEVVPIIRNMSPPQKMAMATLISSRISSNETTPPTIDEIRSIFGNDSKGNSTKDLMLPISMDIAQILSEESTDDDDAEELPEAQELRYLRPSNRRRVSYRPMPGPPLPTLNRRNVLPDGPRQSALRPSRRPSSDPPRSPSESDCTFFTKTVCLQAADYPHEAILRSIRSNKDMVAALLADYKIYDSEETSEEIPQQTLPRYRYPSKAYPRQESRYENNEIKRKSLLSHDNVEEGFTCPSQVKYARPQLARAASGMWKYIINTGEHTQTLRLEKCSTPRGSCSFISENYRSSCVQVYNYHRLLTWDNKLGLHMDIFKIPTCCSCHIHGYTDLFPPHHRDPPPKLKEYFPGADFATEDQKDDLVDEGIHKYNNPKPSSDTAYGQSVKKPVVDTSVKRPSSYAPGRNRPKKRPTVSRPYDKVPQQHAPNTRAPGYTGPLHKRPRPNKFSRPFRRESVSGEKENYPDNITYIAPESDFQDDEPDEVTQLESGFNDDFQAQRKRINYNYHPIIDFFKPEAAMLQSEDKRYVQTTTPSEQYTESWKPMLAP